MTVIGNRRLGSEIRGARLGFRWVSSLQAYMRISDVLDGFQVELAPVGGIPSSKGGYRCWWENQQLTADVTQLVTHTLAGDNTRAIRVKTVVVLIFEDNGTLREGKRHA